MALIVRATKESTFLQLPLLDIIVFVEVRLEGEGEEIETRYVHYKLGVHPVPPVVRVH